MTYLDTLLFQIGQYLLVFICGYLVIRGTIASYYDLKRHEYGRVKRKYETYKLKNKLLNEKIEYHNKKTEGNFLYEQDEGEKDQ